MQQLTKQFTRDFSLYACEWWAYGLCEKFEKEVGRGNRDYIIVSDGKSVTSYYITADFELMKKALLDKLAKAPKWYYSISRKFRDDIDRTRAILEKIKRKKKTSGADARLLKDRHLLLFPMLRLSILIPAVLAEGIKKKVGGKIGKGIISDAYASRKYSDGVFEAIDYLLRELAGKKLRMLGKSNHYAKYLSESELIPLMDGKKINFEILAGRSRGYVRCKGKLFPTKNHLGIFKECGYSYEEEKTAWGAIRGSVAYDGGKVSGKVSKLFAIDEIPKFKPGSVLVTPMTIPDFLPAMKKACAIVTDEGGITCHAAIVARELKIPCIIGTRNATKLLDDGDLAEVDSHTGEVKKIILKKY
ncbi:MAG: PEP-utilizing enzyme [Candidatus Micrarchaeota archaeon]